MTMHIIADRHIAGVEQQFDELGRVTAIEPGAITPARLADADALLVRSVTPVNAALLADTPVRFVGTATSGADHVDTDYLASENIAFASAAGCNARAVAEYVLSTLLVLTERRQRTLQDMTVGIVGCGHVGSQLHKLLSVLGVRCLLNDPPLAVAGDTRDFCSLDDVLHADVVSLHVPLTDTGDYPTRHLLGYEQLRRVPADGILINAARGGVVDESALKKVQTSQSLTLALDTWLNEPAIDAELAARVNVATPHIAGYSHEAKQRATAMIKTALMEWLQCSVPAAPAPTPGVQRQVPLLKPLSEADDFNAAGLAILASYDVRTDAIALRELVNLEASQRAAHFIQLREKYPLRHEFNAIQACLPTAAEQDRPGLTAMLTELGFHLCFAEAAN
ncbi:MAG: 4-phosphoerythronate dehydrogenase [Gammaproteobacteria bacterium]